MTEALIQIDVFIFIWSGWLAIHNVIRDWKNKGCLLLKPTLALQGSHSSEFQKQGVDGANLHNENGQWLES